MFKYMKRGFSMTKKELTKRYLLFIISLFFSAFGVAITKSGELGRSEERRVGKEC